MEQDHLGNFFTKLFYSDAIYPVLPSAGQLSPLDCEFPSVVAPDLSKGMVALRSRFRFSSGSVSNRCLLTSRTALWAEQGRKEEKEEEEEEGRPEAEAARRKRWRTSDGHARRGTTLAQSPRSRHRSPEGGASAATLPLPLSDSNLSTAQLNCGACLCAVAFDGKAGLWRNVRARGVGLRQRL